VSGARPRAAAPDDARTDAAALETKLLALEEGAMRARAAARALAAMEPVRAVAAVAVLAGMGAPRARVAMAAVGQALAAPGPDLDYDRLATLYAAAAERGLVEVSALFVSAPALKPYAEPRERDPNLARLTLGHKKSLARANRDPDLLARLAAEGDPTVVRELLRNPQVTEEFAVRIAARRPCRPATLRALLESRRWRTRPAVALAVVRNPYAEPEVALKLLAYLPARDLADLARDGAVHPLVRTLAERLAAQRRRRDR
jgi:DNA-directed RNA polymerase subunit F